jgi:hypothetical protein
MVGVVQQIIGEISYTSFPKTPAEKTVFSSGLLSKSAHP